MRFYSKSKSAFLVLAAMATYFRLQAAAVIIDPNNGTSTVHVAYSQSTAGVQFTYTEAGNGTFTLTMPAGVTYVPGSMSFTSSAGAMIAESNISNLSAPVFSITGATVGATSVITYGIRSGCATQGSASIGVSVTVGASTDTGNISISILKAALTIDAHDAAVNYSRGGTGSSTCLLTNGGNGSLDSLVFFFKQNGPLVTDSIKANGFLATYIGATGDTLFYQLRGVHFLGGTLDNGESITITRYFHVPVCYNGGTAFPNFQSTYLANFGRNGARCQSPTPGDFGQYNYNSAGGGDPTAAVSQVSVIRTASPCQTALVTYRFTGGYTGNIAFGKGYDVSFAFRGVGGNFWPATGYKIKSAKLLSNNASIPFTFSTSGTNISLANSTAVQGTDPDGAGVGLEDMDGDGYYDDINPALSNRTFDIEVEWEYQKGVPCANNPAAENIAMFGLVKNQCGQDITSSQVNIIGGSLRATGAILMIASPFELGAGQTGTTQTQISRTAPNIQYLSCPTNQFSIRFPVAPGMTVTAIRAGSTNLSFSVVSDTAVALVPTATANPFICDVDYTITPGVTPSGVTPTVILAYECNSTCSNSREDVSCLTGPPILIVAPGPCPAGGGNASNSIIKRTTTGFTDYTGTAYVPLASIPLSSLKRGLPCDSVEITSKGGIAAGNVITGGEPYFYEVSYNLHGTANRLFQWHGGTYTYQSTTAPLPAPVYEANYNGKHYVIYNLGAYPAGAMIDISLKGTMLDAPTLTNTLEGVSGFYNGFFNLDDGFSNPSPNGGDTRYFGCGGQALEFYVRNPRGAFQSGLVYTGGGTCNQFTNDGRIWYLRGTNGAGTEIDYFPGEVRPIDYLDSIVVNLPGGWSYNSAGTPLLRVRGNPGDGGYPSSGQPLQTMTLGAPTIQGNRLVWKNPGNWWVADDALRGGYQFSFPVTTNCAANGYTCGFSIGTGNIINYYGHTNANSRNPTCPPTFARLSPATTTFNGRPVHTVTNLSGTQNADQRVECFNIKLNVSCATSFNTYIYFPGGGPTGTFNITSVKNTTTNAVYPVLQAAGGQWAQLGNVGGDLFLTVCSEYSNCANPDIPYRISWGCSGYPADPATSGCQTLTGSFDLSPAPSGLQAQFIAQPANPVSLCDPLVYDFNMLSTLAADLVDPRLEVTIPAGMAINTVQIEYPYNSGNFETVTPSGTTGTVTVPYGLHSMVHDSLPGVNFQTMPNPRTARMRLGFLTDCNFTSGDRLLVKAKGEEPCGAPAQGNNTAVYSDPINIAGVTQNYISLVNNLDIGPDTIITCSNRTISMDMVMINSTAFPVTLDPALDTVKIDFPAGIQYVPGSYSCSSGSNCFLPPIVNGATLDLTLPVPAGITIPAASSVTVSFSIQINALVNAGCNVPGGLTISMIRSFPGVACASEPGGTCPNPVRFITGSRTVQISPKKANVSTFTARICRTSTNNYDLNGTFNISEGAVPNMQSVDVEVFCLSGGNPVGAPVASQTINGLLNAASGSIPFTGTFSTMCVGESFQVRVSPVTNGGTQQCVCSTVSTNVNLSNPTFTATAGSTCAGSVSVNLPLANITNGGDRYTVDFDDPSIMDITAPGTIPVSGILALPIPSSLASATYTGTVTVINNTTGCTGSAPFSFVVHALPTVDPNASVCVGNMVTLTGSGTPALTNPFVSANNSTAMVTNAGVVTGIAAGTVNIVYTDNNGCSATSVVTVNGLPSLNGGSVCENGTITLTGSGTPAAMNAYISSNTAVATVTNSGLVTGVSAGAATITYTNNHGCQVTATVTVNALPTLAGASVCIGNSTTLLGSGIPNGTMPYVSSDPVVATINNGGLVGAISAGSSTITYTNINGCQATAIVTVNALPTLSNASVCVGGTVTMTGSGTPATLNPYVSSNTAVATIDNIGLVTGIAPGTSIITYTDVNGCQATATVAVTGLIGLTFLNTGSCNYNGTASASDDYFTADVVVTFSTPPATGTLALSGDVLPGSGPLSVNVADLNTQTSHTFSGIRLRADGTASSVTAAFSAVSSCSFTNSNGPSVTACSPTSALGDPCSCYDVIYFPGEHLELLDYIEVTAPAGETWNVTAHTGLLVVDPVNDIPLPVPSLLTYDAMSSKYRIHISHVNNVGYTATLSNGSVTLTINNVCSQNEPVDLVLPAAVCADAATIALPASQTNFTTVYTLNSLVGTVITSFDPTAYTPGTTVRFYARHTPSNMTDCPKTVEYNILINPLPTMAGASVCVGGTTTMTGSGTPNAANPYVSSNTTFATISSAGLVMGIAAGSTTITYTDNNGCQATASVNVTGQQEAGTDGTANICETSTAVLTLANTLTGEDAGGSWAAGGSNPAGGNFNAAAGTFDPTGASIGTYTFNYSFAAAGGCVADMSTATVVVADQKEAGTDGLIEICASDQTPVDLFGQLSGADAGGVWTANVSNPAGGTFSAMSGTFSAVGATPGTFIFNYQIAATGGCVADMSMATVVVIPLPTAHFVPIPANCSGLMQNNNGRLVMTAVTNGDRYGFSTGNVYSGLGYGSATPLGVPPFDVVNNVPNSGQTYTVRIFNGSDDCFDDFTIVVKASNCPSDPLGFIYCEVSGALITGGIISVAPPPGGTYVITLDGSTGVYQFFTDGTAGVWALSYAPPPPYAVSTTRLPAGILDPTGQPDPYIIGSGSSNGTSLDNYTAAANPYHLQFDLAMGDPEILNNNIPIENCCAPPALSTLNNAVCSGSTVNLAAQVTGNTPAGVLTYHNTQADADAGLNPLSVNYPNLTATKTFYVRSTNGAPSCFSTANFTITVEPLPVANPASARACATVFGGSTGIFDLLKDMDSDGLSDLYETITGDQTAPADRILTFHNTLNDAQSGSNPIANPGSFSGTNSSTIWAHVCEVDDANPATLECCSNSAVLLTVDPVPSASIAGDLTKCTGETTTLTANAGNSFLWSTIETTPVIVVSTGGPYSVTVTNSFGCTGSATVNVVYSTPPMVAILTAPATPCSGMPNVLTANGAASYLWGGGETTSAITVFAPGFYSVTGTDANGCTAPASVIVKQSPAATIVGANSICPGKTVQLTANGGISFAWSTMETTQSIDISAPGPYAVTVTAANGCTASANLTVLASVAPIATIVGPSEVCNGSPATFTAGGGGNYAWSNGSTQPSITTWQPGTFSVTVTGANGCSSTASTVLVHKPAPAVPTTDACILSFCIGDNPTIADLKPVGPDIVWYDAMTGGNLLNIMTTPLVDGANYFAERTSANGCPSPNRLKVTVKIVTPLPGHTCVGGCSN